MFAAMMPQLSSDPSLIHGVGKASAQTGPLKVPEGFKQARPRQMQIKPQRITSEIHV